MLRSRPPALQRFIDTAHRAMIGAAAADDPAHMVIEDSFAALSRVGPQAGEAAGARLPVCAHLEMALRKARQGPARVAALADALAALEPLLSWQRRAGADKEDGDFARNHANARIIGEGGLELPEGAIIGVSLMAPEQKYPDHHHPPEEVYIALSPGEWRQGEGKWRAPGVGGLVHNPPNVRHAMRSTDAPLLAIWLLRP